MGSIYPHNKSKKFFYQYYEYDPVHGKKVPKRINLQTKDRTIAESEKKRLDKKYASPLRRLSRKDRKLSYKITEYLAERKELSDNYRLSERTYSTDVGRLNTFLKFIVGEYGDILINRVSQDHIRAYEKHRKRTVAQTTIWIDMRTIKSMFSHYVNSGLLSANPFKGYKIPPSEKRDPESVPDKSEWSRIVAYLQGEMDSDIIDLPMAGIYVLCKTGMRIGEMSRLKWKKTEEFEKYTGFKKSYSILSTDYSEIEMFSKGRPRSIYVGPLLPIFQTIASESPRTKSYVFGNPKTERPFDYSTFRKRFDRMRSELDLSESITPHSLRHGFVTRMVEITKNLVETGEYVGHSSTYMTSRYLHLLKDAQKSFVNQIP